MKTILLCLGLIVSTHLFAFMPGQFMGNPATASYEKIESIFKSYPKGYIKGLIDKPDKDALAAFYKDVSMKIVDYVDGKYAHNIAASVSDMPEVSVMYAYLIFLQESGVKDVKDVSRAAPLELGCLIAAVGGLLGIDEVQSIYHDFLDGVSPSTIIKSLKASLKKVTVIWTVATTIYSMGECLGWW